MDSRIVDVLNKIQNEELRNKVSSFINDISVEIGDHIYTGLELEESPASRFRHHSYPGGLIEHTVSAVKLALAMCDSVEEIYHGKVNRDLAVSGVLMHDILKPLTYETSGDNSYISSPLGERMDHLTLIVAEMIRRGFSLDIVHIVAASHGSGGPVSPRTVEALICHLADQADSQLNGDIINAAKYLVKEIGAEFLEIKSAERAFEIVNSKAEGGWIELKELIKKTRQDD